MELGIFEFLFEFVTSSYVVALCASRESTIGSFEDIDFSERHVPPADDGDGSGADRDKSERFGVDMKTNFRSFRNAAFIAALFILGALSRDSHAAYAQIHSFGLGADGAGPYAGLVQGTDGELYGTTHWGGASNVGTVYKIQTDGTGYALLYSFSSSGGDGNYPYSGLVQGSDGALYGTTYQGGASNVGTVFKIQTDGTGYALLYSFLSNRADGSNPFSGLLQGSDGALYGTTRSGGASGLGTVFKINPDGTGYALLYSFSYVNGANPQGTLIQGNDGALYGTALFGGAWGYGTVYKINTDGTGCAPLHSFTDVIGWDGSYPASGLIQGSDSALYGTTLYGGRIYSGTVYKINTDGTGYAQLSYFAGGGFQVAAGLIQANDGALYGTTIGGGASSNGTLYKIKTDGSGYALLYSFGSSNGDGYDSQTIPIQGSDGVLYGTTRQGGANGGGSIYSYTIFGTLDHFVLTLAGNETNATSFAGVNTLTAKDVYNNTIINFDASADNVTISVNALLTGTVSGLSSNGNILSKASDFTRGVANLTALGMTYTGNAATGTFSATSMTSGKTGTSGNVTINAGALDHFVLTLATSQTNAAGFTGANSLTAQDVSNNTITSYDASANSVTFSVNSPLTGTISGLGTGSNNTLNKATDFVNGVADLTMLGMTYTGNAATGTFSAASTVGSKTGNSGNVTVGIGTAAQLSFTTQPGNGTGGSAFLIQPVVTLQDAGGNTVTGTAQTVTLAIQGNAGPGGTLGGTTSVDVNAATGQATFSGLFIDKTGTGYTLTATGSTVNTTPGIVVSNGFNVTAGSAVNLVFTIQPGNGKGGTPFSVQPVVTIVDAGGNAVTGTPQTVTLSIQNNAGPGGTLSGTASVPVNTMTGQAAFNGLSIDKTGNGYTLSASGNSIDTLAGVIVSNAFSILDAAPVLVSSPTAAPNPAIAGQSIVFTTAASDPDGDTLTYTWDFGDQTTAGGSSVSKTYTVPGTYSAKVTIADSAGSVAIATLSVTVNAAASSAPPRILQGPTLLSNMAISGLPLVFTCASDQAVTWTWNFGDGSPGAGGEPVSHVFANPGAYTITATATNATGQSSSNSLTLTLVPLVGSLSNFDSTGNGLPFEIDQALGIDPLNTTQAPSIGPPRPLNVTQLNIVLHFIVARDDSITLKGTLPVPDGFTTKGQTVLIDVGGAVKIFTLDAHGNAQTGTLNKIKLMVKSTRGITQKQNARFAMTLIHNNLSALLADEGLTRDAAKKAPRVVPVLALFNQQFFRTDQHVQYTVGKNNSKATLVKYHFLITTQ